MSGYVIEIPQEKENGSIWSQQLRVAAYCRVSTPYEEQQKSLEKQIEYFTRYIKRNLSEIVHIDDEYRTALLDYHEKYERWNLQIIPQELE